MGASPPLSTSPRSTQEDAKADEPRARSQATSRTSAASRSATRRSSLFFARQAPSSTSAPMSLRCVSHLSTDMNERSAELTRARPADAHGALSLLDDFLPTANGPKLIRTLMQIGDTFNHLFGRTHNPINRKLSPGGSSGGEGALIAMKGSILGVVRPLPPPLWPAITADSPLAQRRVPTSGALLSLAPPAARPSS